MIGKRREGERGKKKTKEKRKDVVITTRKGEMIGNRGKEGGWKKRDEKSKGVVIPTRKGRNDRK